MFNFCNGQAVYPWMFCFFRYNKSYTLWLQFSGFINYVSAAIESFHGIIFGVLDFPKELLSAYIEVKTFTSSSMSSSSLSLDNWSFKTVWINSSDCPGAIASANFFSSCYLNRMNLPFKRRLVFSINSSTFCCLIWYWIVLASKMSLRELPLACAFSITSLDNMVSSG